MSGFDPLTHAAAREARPPAGALMPALQVDPSILPPGWCQLDGSLVSREVYPDAAKIVGDVRFFNSAPIEATTDLTMRAGVQSVSQMKYLAFGSTFIAAGLSFATGVTDITSYRLWRSADAGATWQAIDLPALPSAANQWRAESLEWFGAGRVLLVLMSTTAANRYSVAVTFSNDSGQTWSAPKELLGVASGYLTLDSVSADAEMVAGGSGYYYVGIQNNQASPASAVLYALNPTNNTVSSLAIPSDGASAQRCRVLGGRVVGAGVSEVHYAIFGSGAWGLSKINFNGAAFSGGGASSLALTPIGSIYGMRQFLTKGGDGSYYWVFSAAAVMKMPANWAGVPLQVHTGHDNTGWRLLTNTLANATTGQRYDCNTGVSSVIGGMNAGRGKVGTLHGVTDRAWSEAVVIDKTPSNDRHFMHVVGVSGSFAVRTTRAADNFVGGLSDSPDNARFLPYPSGTCNWHDPATGQIKSVDLVAGPPSKLRVRTYAPANDYATYAHLPYLPGLMARLR
ncbi:sialidase family protein [Roseateles flavus]|uniref:Sialidase family protein n=1 Tax=Roseateles flavus TaxID=3149041 RepID=A0ABV0GG65_9BURK